MPGEPIKVMRHTQCRRELERAHETIRNYRGAVERAEDEVMRHRVQLRRAMGLVDGILRAAARHDVTLVQRLACEILYAPIPYKELLERLKRFDEMCERWDAQCMEEAYRSRRREAGPNAR